MYHSDDEFLASFPTGGLVVEVGVLHGHHAHAMRRFLRPDRLVLIDTWAAYHSIDTGVPLDGDETYEGCRKLFADDPTVELWRGWSTEMIPKLDDRSVAFAYVDAGHLAEECLADLEALLPKMSPGGWLCGHDYCEIYQYGVVRAVAVFLDRHRDLGLKIDKLTDLPLADVIGSDRRYYPPQTACNSFGIQVPA